MIDIDEVLAESVGGSVAPAVAMTVWRDGELIYPTASSVNAVLEVESWRTIEDATQSARTCEFTVVGQDPALIPRSLDAVFSPFSGTEVHLQSGADLGPELGARLASEGWFRIDGAKAVAFHEHYEDTDAWALQGVAIEGDGTDRMGVLADARFEETVTRVSGTVYSAIRSLCSDLVPVATTHFVADAAIPTIAFDTDDRVQAIDTLAKRIEARAVMSREGQLVLKPRSSATGTWAIPDWSLLSVDEELRSDDFYNAVVAIGRDPVTQEELRGRYVESSGPSRYRTGLKKPYFYASPLLTTTAQCVAAARTTFENVVHRRQSVARISVPPHPGVEALDDVLLQVGGETLTGSVRRVERSGGRDMEAAMLLDVWLPLEDSRRLL